MRFDVHRKTESHLELVARGTTTTTKSVSCAQDIVVAELRVDVYLPPFRHLKGLLLDESERYDGVD